jgi:hypothetical protein
MSLHLPSSKLQASVASGLDAFRRLYLQQALSETIETLDLSQLNAELDAFASAEDLKKLASLGVRGEFVFPVPSLLRENPRLLGYYRLLLGYSQKEFFNKGKLGRFAGMEEKGKLSSRISDEIDELCLAFCQRASELLNDIGIARVSLDFLEDLTLLTLGPQLRGSNNTKIGRLGEAEKSHQSAKQRGFVEFWTIYNVPTLDLSKAHEKSPTSNRFYSLPELLTPTCAAFEDFRGRLMSLVGIAVGPSL